jgi:transposase-like protein
MAEFAQLQLRFLDQTQWRYEVIHPLVLVADRTPQQRAHETHPHPDTVRTLQRRFRQQGIRGLLPEHAEVVVRKRTTRIPEAVRREVDQDGHILDILVQRRRDKQAAKKFFRKRLKTCRYVPRVIVTDRLKRYAAAKREVLPSVEHRQHRYLQNRAENSHHPTRQRERRMQGCNSAGQAQRFLAVVL